MGESSGRTCGRMLTLSARRAAVGANYAMPMTSSRRASIAGLFGVLGIILLATLSPTPVDAGRGAWVDAVLAVLHRVGVPGAFGYRELEMSANVAMFVPLGALLALVLVPGWRWFGYVIVPLLSAGIELGQWLFLSRRDGAVSDIVTNTIGGWIGLSLVIVVLRFRSRKPRR